MSSPSTLVQPVPRRADRRLDTAWLGGVCSGLAAHLNWPVLVLRLGFVLLSASMGIGVLVYLVLWLAMPLGVATLRRTGKPDSLITLARRDSSARTSSCRLSRCSAR